MAGYDPQKSRGRREIPADEPAPVDGLLGPAPDEPETGPVLAHDAGRPMVRQVLPVPPRPADDAEHDATAPEADPEDVAEDAVAAELDDVAAAESEDDAAPASRPAPDVVIDLDAQPATATAAADELAATAAAPVAAAPRAATTPTPTGPTSSSRAQVAAVIAAIVALVVVVLWRRRHRR
jgi:hypothetical protein